MAAASQGRKSILVVGLGRNMPESFNTTDDEIRKLVEADAERAKSLGFDCEPLYLSADGADDAIRSLKQALQRQHWDGLSIGFGVRGRKEYTKMFEDLVNAAVEVKGGAGMKFLFSTEPDGIVNAIRRTFPGVGEEKAA
jgi:hypothetical protein